MAHYCLQSKAAQGVEMRLLSSKMSGPLQVDVHVPDEERYSSFSESEGEGPSKRPSEKVGAQTEMHPWRRDQHGATQAGSPPPPPVFAVYILCVRYPQASL